MNLVATRKRLKSCPKGAHYIVPSIDMAVYRALAFEMGRGDLLLTSGWGVESKSPWRALAGRVVICVDTRTELTDAALGALKDLSNADPKAVSACIYLCTHHGTLLEMSFEGEKFTLRGEATCVDHHKEEKNLPKTVSKLGYVGEAPLVATKRATIKEQNQVFESICKVVDSIPSQGGATR